MQISVVIPTFNRAAGVVDAINSVLAQSYLPKEIIVVDDGSEDETPASLFSLKNHGRIKYIRLEKNLGVSAARNVGIAAAQYEWLALLDSDDTWLPHKLAEQCKAAKDAPEGKVFHTDEIWIRNGKRVNAMKKHAKPDGWVYEASLALCCVSPSSVLMHRSVFEQCGVFDESLPACEDYDLWLRIFSQFPVKLIKQPLLIKTGGHADQLSRKYWGMDRFRVIALCKMLDSKVLDQQARAATFEMLKQKCKVLSLGAKKRGKTEQSIKYAKMPELYV